MNKKSKLALILIFLITALILSPISDVLAINYEAQINVGFPGGSVLVVGETTVLQIDILNTNPFILENASFTDSLEVSGQTGLVVHSDGVLTNTCGGIVIADPDTTKVSLSGGVVPAAVGVTQGTCSITVRVLATSEGTKQSYIPAYGNPPSHGGVGFYSTARGGLDIITNATRQPSITTLTVNPVETPTMNKNFSPTTVWAGESTQLEINITNTDLTYSLTGVTYTDTLPATFVVSSPLTTSTSGCGGGTIDTSVGSNSITLNNGTIVPSSTCTVRVRVVSSAQGTYTNTIPAGPDGVGSLQTDQYVTNPSDVTAPVNVQSVGIDKAFNPGSIAEGDTSTLTITLQNPSSTTYTNMHFADTLPSGLVVTGTPEVNQCGGTVSISADNRTITLDNGVIPTGNTTTPGSCTVVVTVTSSDDGSYPNTIPAGGLTGSITNTMPAEDTLTVVPRTILVDKDLGSDFVENETSSMTITLSNQASTAFTGVNFTDTMPANLTIVGTPTASASCGTSAVVTTDGTSLTLTGGVIPAGSVSSPGTCTITADIMSSVAGNYTNTIDVDDVCSAQGICNASDDSDNVWVYAIGGEATVSKYFNTSGIQSGNNARLRINITSPRDTGLSQIHLIDYLPGDMVLTTNPTTNCGGTLSGGIGDQYVELTGGSIANPNSSCRIEVYVTAYTPGTLTNTIPGNSLSTYEGRTDTHDRTDTLNISSFSMSKQFEPELIAPGGLSLLTIFLNNNNLQPITDLSLSDNLGAMDQASSGYTVRVYNPGDVAYVPTTDCGSGVITAANGASTISLSGATIPPSDGTVDGLCRINVYVTGGNTSGEQVTRTNTVRTSNVSGTINGTTTIRPVGNASASLGVDDLEMYIDKAFFPLSVYNGSFSTMTVELLNPNLTASLSDITFTDSMPTGMILADPVNADVGTCGGTITGSPGDGSFTFSGGSLPPSDSCTMSVHVGMTVGGNLINTIPAGNVTSFEGAVNSNTEDETLTNAVGAFVLKSFSPNPIQVGQESVLSIEIFNTSSTTDLTGIGTVDNLPSGVTIADDGGTTNPILENTCGGTLTTGVHASGPNTGQSFVNLVNGEILRNSSCIVRVRVTSGTAGAYENIITASDVTPPLDPDHAHDTLYVTSFSLGNRVWDDNGAGSGTANDGFRNGSEPGINGLDVNLYLDSDNDGIPDGAVIDTTTTDADGYYRFDDLVDDTYLVEVEIPTGYISSGVNGGDPDTDIDNDNNGVDLSNPGYIRSDPVTLEPTAIEPTNDNDPAANPEAGEGINEQSNRSVDFGFYRPFSLGNRVWDDTNGDGDQDAGELGISDVTVRLYLDENTDDVPDGSEIDFTVTDASGYYRFDDLPAGSYIVEVVTPSGYRSTNNAVSDPDDDVDLDHNGFVEVGVNIRSNHVTLGAGAVEPTGDNDPATNPQAGEAPDAQSNRTVDFGFTNAYSLGNRVWNDNGNGGGTADDGIHDSGEPGFGGVTVNLYRDSDNNGTPDGVVIATITTDADGYYRFDRLAPDTYIVEIEMPTGYQISAVDGGDPDTDVDRDNNGVDELSNPGYIRSNPVTLGGGSEPTGDDDPVTNPQTGEAPDAYSNRTVDFGLYAAPLSLGDLVWVDDGAGTGTANNGIFDGSEVGLAGVTVRLYRTSNPTTPLAITETNTNGNYLFENLAADDYQVEILIPAGYAPSSVNNPADPTDSTNNDNNGVTITSSTIKSTTIELTADDMTIDFGLIQYASLGDRVWYDTDRDGVQDVGEDGVTGVMVTLFTGVPGSGTQVATTTTTGGGYYNFSDLEPRSDYYVEFTLPAIPPGYSFSPSGAGTAATDSDVTTITGNIGRTVNIDLEAFEDVLTWDAGIYLPPASIGDRVWYDDGSGATGVARDGIQNGSEPGAPGITVELFRPGYGADGIPATPDDNLPIASQNTDGSGNYLFDELVPGDYSVRFTAPAGYAFSPQDQGGDDALDSDADRTSGQTITTTLIADEDDLTWDAGLYKLASIGDYVWLDHGGGTPTNAYNGVQDTGESGIQGVAVNLYTGSGTFVASTSTSGIGAYLFDNLEPGDYYVEFIPPTGYSISPQNQGDFTDPVEQDKHDSDADPTTGRAISTNLIPDEYDQTWDAGMYQYASIGDFVWDDNGVGGGIPRNGIQDGTESGVAGVTVTLYNGSGTQVGLPTTTDANGNYSFTELVPGDYFVVFSDLPAGYQFSPIDAGADDVDSDAATSGPTIGQTIPTTLDPGENDITWDAGIHMQPAALGDYVWYDDNGNGIQEVGELPAENVTVNLYNAAGSIVDTQQTNASGNYLFDNLNPGYYSLGFVAPTGYNFTLTDQGSGPTQDEDDSDVIIPPPGISEGRTNFTELSPGETDLTWDAGLYNNASLGNFVWEDWNMNGVQDVGDPGINGVTVDLYRDGFGFIASTTTATDLVEGPGYYLFDDLVPGEYYVVFTLPSGYQFTTQGAGPVDTDSNADTTTGQTPNVTLGSGDANMTVDAGMVPMFSLGNRVWFDTNNNSNMDAGEQGISGVTVELYDSTGTTQILVGPDGILGTADDASGGMTTDASGHYLFNNLLAGDYTVVLPASNFAAGGPLEGYYSTGTSRNAAGNLIESLAAIANSDIDLDDNGTLQTSGAHNGGVIASAVTLGQTNPAAEPVGETDLGSAGQGGRPDNYANMTADFGFYHMQLGNVVWNDADDSGGVSIGETGIDDVTVQLWSADGSTMLDSTITTGGGFYGFDDLPAGNYIIRIPSSEFEGIEPLRNFRSSTGNGSEPAPDADVNTTDQDDNGSETGGTLGLGGYIQTEVFTLSPGSEQSVDHNTGLTTENRIDLGLRNAPQVDLAITKDDGRTYYIAGSTLTYEIVITNNGPADVTGAIVSDTMPSQVDSWNWTCDATTPAPYACDGGTTAPFSDTINLPYGASLTYSVEAIVSATATGQLDNRAVVSPPTDPLPGTTETDTNNNSATDSDLEAGLIITKDDDVTIVAPGTTLSYHVVITNSGAVDMTDLTVTDTLPDDVSFVRAYQGATDIPPTNITGNVLTWDTSSAIVDLSNLTVGNTIEFDIEVVVVATPTNASIINNIEVVDGTTGANDDDDDTDNLLNANVKALTGTSEADSGTGSIVDPEPVFIGEILTYTVTLDIPPGIATNLQALDILDRGLAFVGCVSIEGGTLTTDLTGGFAAACAAPIVSAEPIGDPDLVNQGRRVQFDLGNVSSTSLDTLTLTYEAIVLDVAENYDGVDDLNNAVTWSWDASSSISDETTPVTIDEPELTIDKEALPIVAPFGMPIDFTLDIAHSTSSTAPAYDVLVTDVLPAGLSYVTGSLAFTGLAPTNYNYEPTTFTLTFDWDVFPLGATSTIAFQAVFVGPSPVENAANVEWTSLEIDPGLGGTPVLRSPYNIYSTERWYDPADQTINDYRVRDTVTIILPDGLPLTGFKPGVMTNVPVQPVEKAYQNLDGIYLEIPKQGINIPVMGISYVDDDWDLTWLSDQAGYLEGSTYPGHVGNTAITSHTILADGTPGPFHDLDQLSWNDEIILHIDGQKYVYLLRQNLQVFPNDFSAFHYDGYTWLTLITCSGYSDYTEEYQYRTLVKAVLVRTEPE